MNEKQHLWEVKHSYYCTEGQYFSNQTHKQTIFDYSSFEDFLNEWGDADKDYNLLFRWDWSEPDEDEDGEPLPPFDGNVTTRNGKLVLFFMMQRKGYHQCARIDVCRADEDAVIEFIQPRLAHLQRLWAPLWPTTPE